MKEKAFSKGLLQDRAEQEPCLPGLRSGWATGCRARCLQGSPGRAGVAWDCTVSVLPLSPFCAVSP